MAIKSTPVLVYKDDYGVYPEGCTKRINCEYKRVGEERISVTPGSNNCGRISQPGTQFPDAAVSDDTTLVDTVVIHTVADGNMYIRVADYDTLLEACNACCIEN